MASHGADEARIPIIEERIDLETRRIDTERVRVRTQVDVHDAPVEALLRQGSVEVERVAVEREVAEAPVPYQDGDVLVVPVVEERLVIEKRLFVIEEVRITSSVRDEDFSSSIPLRRMRAVVERDQPETLTTGQD